MAKLDYKKLWEQQKKNNIKIVSENVRLIKEVDILYQKAENFEGLFREEVKNSASWEQLYNKQQGQATGIMRCFKELLNHKKK